MSDISSRIIKKNKQNRQLIPLTISAQDGLINQYDYFDKQIASLNLTTYYILSKGEFAYNKSYSNGYPFGAIKRLDNYEEGVLSSLYICFSIKNVNSDFICKYFDSNKWNNEVKLISGEGARNHGLLNLSPNDFFNIKIWLPNNVDEQIKIAFFLELIQRKINIAKNKIDALKKYKSGLERVTLKTVCSFGKKISFSELYKIKNEKNNTEIKQYTIGKYGIKEMHGEKHDISKHKLFRNKDLIIGIGLDEIGISDNLIGCASPVYDVFSILNSDYFQSMKYTLKNQLWNKRRFITKKSTRREFEMDKSELMKIEISIMDNNSFKPYYRALENLDIIINALEMEHLKLTIIKTFLLNNMFI